MKQLHGWIIIIVVIVVNMVACGAQGLTNKEAYTFIKEYREVKSREQASNGKIFNKNQEQYWAEYISLFNPPENHIPKYYIYADDFRIISVSNEGDDEYEKGKKGKTYFVKIEETIKGIYENGIVDVSKAKKFETTYWLIVTDKGLRIFGDPDTDDFNILEKHLPLLKEQLNKKK